VTATSADTSSIKSSVLCINGHQEYRGYIFPGVGLGILAAGARWVADAMFMATAKVVAEMSPTATEKQGRLLLPVCWMREVSTAVAKAVARQAQADGVVSTVGLWSTLEGAPPSASMCLENLHERIDACAFRSKLSGSSCLSFIGPRGGPVFLPL
jgi:malic enzyme